MHPSKTLHLILGALLVVGAAPALAQYPGDEDTAGLEDDVIVPATAPSTDAPDTTEAPPTTAPAPEPTGEAAPAEDEAAFVCPPEDVKLDRMYVICGVVQNDRLAHVKMFPEPHGVLEPNRAILVRIQHPADRKILIDHQGTVGLQVPRIQAPPRLASRGPAEKIPLVVTQKTLPPHLPPKATVMIGLMVPGASTPIDTMDLEFAIRDTFAGALRIGVGAVGLGAASPSYSVRTRVGSLQPEVVAQEGSAFDMELVVGYAAFLDNGGRPANGCRAAPMCFAPYVGIGVLTQGNAGLELFSSFHIGLEWAPVTGFSTALTFVGRRIDQLASGLQVGAPARVGDDITVKRYGLGAGLVFNVSPDVFKFASRTAAGLLE